MRTTSDVTFSDYQTSSTEWTLVYCGGGHSWHCESLRGTNCNQRVEHVRCVDCGIRRTRVWFDLPKAPRPDRVYRREPAA